MILPAVFPTGTVITKVEKTHTSAEDGGENVITAEFFNGKKATFKVRNGRTGKGGRIEKVRATVNSAVGTPEVTVQEGGTPENKELTLSFKNLKGDKGDTGNAAGFTEPTAEIDDKTGTPSVSVTASGADTSKQFHFSFKNLKGDKGDTGADGASLVGVTQTKQSKSDGDDNVIEFTLTDGSKSRVIIRNGSKGDKGDTGADGASLVGVTQTKQSKSDGDDNVIEFTLTDGSKSRVIIRNGSKGDKGDKPDGRMPLNPAAIYDFADAVTRWKKEPIFSISNIKSRPDHPRVFEPFTLENNKIFKITANITWTGDAKARLIVTRKDWKEIVLDTTFSGVGSWRVIIPETNTYFGSLWMRGGNGYKPKPDDSVTVKSFAIHQLEQETITDTSGNGGVGFMRGHIGCDSAVGKTFTPFEKGCFYFEAYREHSALWLGIGRAWTHSRWIMKKSIIVQTLNSLKCSLSCRF